MPFSAEDKHATGGGRFEHRMWTSIIYDILYWNFQTQLFEILLFCSVKTGCFVEYNACYMLHFVTTFVTAIILHYTKNMYKNMQLQTTLPESKFPNECSDAIFIQIDQHLKKLLQKYKGVPILWNTVYTCYSAAYTWTRDQKRFTISEVAADWHELMIPRHMTLCGHPLPALANNWTRGAAYRHTTAPISHTRPSPRSS